MKKIALVLILSLVLVTSAFAAPPQAGKCTLLANTPFYSAPVGGVKMLTASIGSVVVVQSEGGMILVSRVYGDFTLSGWVVASRCR